MANLGIVLPQFRRDYLVTMADASIDAALLRFTVDVTCFSPGASVQDEGPSASATVSAIGHLSALL